MGGEGAVSLQYSPKAQTATTIHKAQTARISMRYITRIMTLAAVCTAIALMAIITPAGTSHEEEPEGMTTDILLPTTPVKDQGHTPLCWAYAMLAAIETDRIVIGDSVNLSPQWIARAYVADQIMEGKATRPRLSATLPEAFWIMQHYGIVSWDSYKPRQNMGIALGPLDNISPSASPDVRRRRLERALDTAFGPPPLSVFMLGAMYTPLQFAHSIAMPDEWTAYTSIPGQPYGKMVIPDIPDNTRRHKAMNVSPEDMLRIVHKSLSEGHPVAWEGDMKPERPSKVYSLERQRQQLMNAGLITDDHAMAIIGTGHNAEGRYLIMKNSWGRTGRYYMTEAEFILSTIMIMARNT